MHRKLLSVRLAPVALLVVALVLLFAGCGGDTETTTTAAPSTETTAPQSDIDAAALFSANCASCHGAGGEGGIGPELLGEDDVARIETQVANGGGSMPAFGATLSAEEISALAEYVVGLQ